MMYSEGEGNCLDFELFGFWLPIISRIGRPWNTGPATAPPAKEGLTYGIIRQKNDKLLELY